MLAEAAPQRHRAGRPHRGGGQPQRRTMQNLGLTESIWDRFGLTYVILYDFICIRDQWESWQWDSELEYVGVYLLEYNSKYHTNDQAKSKGHYTYDSGPLLSHFRSLAEVGLARWAGSNPEVGRLSWSNHVKSHECFADDFIENTTLSTNKSI